MTSITQAQINRCTDKQTQEVYFTIKSDSQANTWYTQTWNNATYSWECDCPRPNHLGCKHLRAVNEVLRSKRSDCLDSRYTPITDVSTKGHLNGSTSGFSLLK